MGKNILIVILVLLILRVQWTSSEIQGENSKLIADNSLLSYETIELQWDVNRRDAVIAKLEELKGVAVSEITYYAPTGNHTYTGTVPKAGRTVAVDPNIIPLGSDVFVEGKGWFTAEDTGGAIDGTDVDVFVDSDDEARRGGRHHAGILWREVKE
jgi:3D (Asp-Asp-Asp) domain-containing protein